MSALLRFPFFLWVCLLVPALLWGEDSWPPNGFEPAKITTREGSSFFALIAAEPAPQFIADGKPQSIPWNTIKSLKIGKPFDEARDKQARALIKDLESDQFEKRKAATDNLAAMGHAAVPALRDGLKAGDSETVERCKKILGMIGTPDVRIGDSLELKEGAPLTGKFSTNAISVVTRWKYVEFDPQELLEVRPTQELLEPDVKKALRKTLAAQNKPVAAKPSLLPIPEMPVRTMDYQGFNPLKDGLTTESTNMASFDRGADLRTKISEGEKINDLYLSWGLKIGIPGSAQEVIGTKDEPLKAKSGPMSCCAKTPMAQGDLEFSFWVPQPIIKMAPMNTDPVPGGVYAVGFSALGKNPGVTVVELFDFEGRTLYKGTGDERHAAGERRIEFFGIYSKVLIHKVRVTRAGKNDTSELRIDDFTFTPVMAAARDPRLASAEFANGERIWGLPSEAKAPEKISLLPAFVEGLRNEKDPPADFSIENLQRFSCPRLKSIPIFPAAKDIPALIPEIEDAPENEKHVDDPLMERLARPIHDVLLQNGDAFPATLYKLDEKEVTLLLPGAVKLVLPRETLRKIDLRPKRLTEIIAKNAMKAQLNPDGEEPFEVDFEGPDEEAAISVTETEKPGVEFRDKNAEQKDAEKVAEKQAEQNAGNPANPPKKPKKPDPPKAQGPNPAQGLPRMDNAEILKVDFATGELTVDPKDGGGAWPIDLQAARYLIFKPLGDEKAPKGGPKNWTLVLRQGKRFDVNLKSITQKSVKVEIAGGEAEFPFSSVAFVERKKE